MHTQTYQTQTADDLKRAYQNCGHEFDKNYPAKARESKGPCPLCGGTDRFHIAQGDTKPLMYCRQCNADFKDFLAVLGVLDKPELPAPPAPSAPRPSRKVVKMGTEFTPPVNAKEWRYCNPAGEPVLSTFRWLAKGGKNIRQATPDGNGGYQTGCIPEVRPLLYSEHLARLPKEHQVLIVEGETCVDAAIERTNLPTTTWPGGTGGADKADLSVLDGHSVILWPDADEPGKAAMRTIAKRLPKSCQISWVEPPEDKPKGWDIANADAATCKRMIAEAKEYQPEPSPYAVREWKPEVRSREFLVPLLVQRGRTTRICGAPKVGKSVMLASLLARLSRKGATLPGGGKSLGYRILYLPLEEVIEEDVNPRLIAAKTDFQNLREIEKLAGLVGTAFAAAIMEGVNDCADWQPDIIAIDPLAAFMRKINDADSSRTTLTALNDLAAHCNAAVLVVDHNAKMTKRRMTETDNLHDLASGSVQATATVRLQWGIHKRRVKENDEGGEPAEGDNTPVMIYAGGNADWIDSNRPPTEYRLHSEAKEVAPGCVGRYIETFEPTSGNAEAMIAEANGRVAPSETEEAICDLLADGRYHQLSEIEGLNSRTLTRHAKKMTDANKLLRMSAGEAKARELLDGEVTNNRANAYKLADL